MELLQKATSVAMLVFVLSSMVAMGLNLTVPWINNPLRNAQLVVLSLLVNFVLMPLGALALASLLRLDQPMGVGLLLLGSRRARRSYRNWLRSQRATWPSAWA